MTIQIEEGAVKLKVEKTDKISKEMEVFYNPVMELNRSISVLLLNSINRSSLQIADPLAGTGVRSIRFLKELGKDNIKKICINDYSKKAVNMIKKNLELNRIKYRENSRIAISNEDANLFLLNSPGFDYIDIDPFGTPNPFLDSACKRIARNGIIAVTATDTSALCGTFPRACMRKYWALPRKGAVMHETGLRILIRKVQLIAAQYDKALIPIFSYSKEHYMRVFLKNDKGKNKVDEILKMHSMFKDSGPMWMGKLWDEKLTDRIYTNALKNRIFRQDRELINFLKIIKEESGINVVGFYDLHEICQKYSLKQLKKNDLISKIKKKGYKASSTHFKGEGIRSDMPLDKVLRILKS